MKFLVPYKCTKMRQNLPCVFSTLVYLINIDSFSTPHVSVCHSLYTQDQVCLEPIMQCPPGISGIDILSILHSDFSIFRSTQLILQIILILSLTLFYTREFESTSAQQLEKTYPVLISTHKYLMHNWSVTPSLICMPIFRFTLESYLFYPTHPSNYGIMDLFVYFKIVKIAKSIKTRALV